MTNEAYDRIVEWNEDEKLPCIRFYKNGEKMPFYIPLDVSQEKNKTANISDREWEQAVNMSGTFICFIPETKTTIRWTEDDFKPF